MPRYVLEDARQRIWVLFSDYPPMVFDSAGRFVRTVGRRGRGPGEFLGSPFGVAAGDSVVIFDPALGRATVFDSELLALRTITVPSGINGLAVPSWPDHVVLHMLVRTPALAGLPLHIADLSGSTAIIRRSFGNDRGVLLPGNEHSLLMHVTTASGITFWSADQLQYRLTKWATDGRKLVSFVSAPTWITNPQGSFGIGGRNKPPAPRIVGLHEDSRQRLWLFGLTAAPDWRSAWVGKALVAGEHQASSLPSLMDLYETIIEVIDPEKRRVVARRSWDKFVLGVLSSNKVARYYESDGSPILQIARLQLVERR